jgi:nucleotide-binding universal stress UspA family protein
MSKPIALAIDFKKFTPSVLTTGEFLLKNIYPSSKAILFHVIEQFFTPPAYLLPYLNIEKERLEKALNELMAPISKKGFRVEKAVILGEFWTALRNFVELLDPELIILGYEPHLIKIPTAEKILERLEISFLVVKENPLKKLNKILCPFDFSEKALSALKKAFYYAEKTQAELIVLYVINPLESPDKTCNLQYVTEREKEIKENWKNLLNTIKPPDINFRFETVCGNRLDEIMQKVEQESIDLIIVGRRGKILQTGIGSVSKALIKTSKIPVLLVN